MVNTAGAQILGGSSSAALNLAWQLKAWRFYGAPDGTASAGLRMNQGAIGEVRFVVGWIAQQIGRVGWNVKINGVELNAAQSLELMKKISNRESTIIISTNLLVAGELNYVAITNDKLNEAVAGSRWEDLIGPALPGDGDARWLSVSVVNNYRRQIIDASDLNLKAVWPHPAKPNVPDPPLRSVLDVLEEIEQLQDLAYSQNRSRIAQMGILTVANEFDMATPGGDFGTRLEEAINSPIVDPRRTSASPILLRGPFELMTGALSNGARAVQWTKPSQEFDDSLDRKMSFLIQRLAWGFPVAPEILLGMTATNRAVAFQVEESTYRSHIEPIADLVGRVYAGALRLIIDPESYEGNVPEIEVTPDATELLARRHSVADAKDAYDRGLVRASWVRRVLGIKEEDKAEDEDIERIITLRKGGDGSAGGQSGREPDPSEVAGNEPVRASGAVADTRAALIDGLQGACAMAHTTAVTRVGASARTRLGRVQLTPALELDPELISNRQLPSMLGPDRLTELQVKTFEAVEAPTEFLVEWWEGRLRDEEVPPSEFAITESCLTLGVQFKQWSTGAATAWPVAKVPDHIIAAVLASAFDLVDSVPEPGGE